MADKERSVECLFFYVDKDTLKRLPHTLKRLHKLHLTLIILNN